MNFCNEIQLTFCLKYLPSMCVLHNRIVSLLIAEVPKKINILAVELAVCFDNTVNKYLQTLLKEI